MYLGDGLYANHDGYQFELYTNNGPVKENKVYLDSTTLGSFLLYVGKILNVEVILSPVEETLSEELSEATDIQPVPFIGSPDEIPF